MEKDWEQEQLFLEECRELIAENVKTYDAELKERHAKTQELYKALQSGDVELYNQLMTSTSLEEHTANQLRKNKAAYQNPYFGRIDYLDKEVDKESRVYIGKHGVFRDRIEVVVADWRAPISSVYYENEIGDGSYKLPDGKEQSISLRLKRTYDISEGNLNGYYDSDVAANDELLIKYLSQNKEAVLGDIIATIQKEQNVIIRESPFVNILVQGVAGSGKTTVAMHRISYILYNYKERFTSNEFCIIGGNELLLSYITSGLPELDVHDVKQKRMDIMFTHLLKKEWTKKHSITEVLPDAKVRSKMDFLLNLELYLLHLREEKVHCRELRDKELGVILTGSSMERLRSENPEYSIYRLLLTLDERVRTRLKFLCPEGEKEYLQEKYRKYKDHYKNQAENRSIYTLYELFLADYEKQHPGSLDLAAHERNATAKIYDVYDLAALVLIYYRVKQKKEDMEFGQIFIDEAQDFGIASYYVLRRVLPACYFTIMGDVSQNINYETGMNDWEDMRKWVLTGERDCFKMLQKSYRNTIEISEYAGKILERAAGGTYRVRPVIRHGIPVQEYELTKEEEMYKKAQEIIETAKKKGYESIAVVCGDAKEAKWVEKWLEEATVLPVQLVKGLEFDAVLLWNPKRLEEIENKAQAKLFYVACTRALHELHLLRMRG
ncbi:MAG: ATP-binding domain-containing protein [Lachnospiraceae bacterium]|nr:ATP-binding domain-containing protein [Lachnospiraceae bacterium]